MRNSIVLLIALSALGLGACAHLNPHPMDMTQAIKNATTKTDHEALAKHYENAAKDLEVKLNEYKRVLEEYELHGAYYGKQALDLQSHARSSVTAYEQAIKANLDMAKSHRVMVDAIK